MYSPLRVSFNPFLFVFSRPSFAFFFGEHAAGIERTIAHSDRCDPEPPRQLQGRFLHITDLHPDPLYRPGGALSTACHRNRPKKEKQRAGYLGTPYFEFVILSFFPIVPVIVSGSICCRKILVRHREVGRSKFFLVIGIAIHLCR